MLTMRNSATAKKSYCTQRRFFHLRLHSCTKTLLTINLIYDISFQVDAYLTPCIKKYLDGFASGFVNNLDGVKVAFMQSDGGLTPMNSFNGSRAILSGPAGGVVGYAMTTSSEQQVKQSLFSLSSN